MNTKIKSGPLVKRFTKVQAERAAEIANDIAENIDNGESRAELRMTVALTTDLLSVESGKRAEYESKLALYTSAKALMDLALNGASKLKLKKRRSSK